MSVDNSYPRDFTFGGEPIDPELLLVFARDLADMRKRYPDFDQMQPRMEALAKVVTPNEDLITPFQFFELIYLGAKYGSFCADAQQKQLQEAVVITRKM